MESGIGGRIQPYGRKILGNGSKVESRSLNRSIGVHTSGTVKTIDIEPMLAKKLVTAIARGDLCFMSRIGITGYGEILVSTNTKATPQTMLADMRPNTIGWDQGSSSVDFRDIPSNRHPTVETRVSDPRKSIRLSLVRRGKERTSSGSGILTLVNTSITESAKMGACDRPWIGHSTQNKHPSLMVSVTRLEQKCRSPDRISIGNCRELFRKQTYQPNWSLNHPPSGPPRAAPAEKILRN